MNEKTIYEPHPVSPERKQELRRQGYRIIDAIFEPKTKRDVDGGDEDSAGKKPKQKNEKLPEDAAKE